MPESVYSLGVGLSSVEAWFSAALDIEDVLSGTGGINCMLWLLMLLSPLIRLTSLSWIVFWVDLVCLLGFEGCIFLFIIRFG